MFTQELKGEIKSNKEKLANLEDAEMELELADEDQKLSLIFGHCFIKADVDDCQDYVKKQQVQIKKEIEDAQIRVKEANKRAQKLKSILYSKFGGQI